jgi:hypothetical protein
MNWVRVRPHGAPICCSGLTAARPVMLCAPEFIQIRMVPGVGATVASSSVLIEALTATPSPIGWAAHVGPIIPRVIGHHLGSRRVDEILPQLRTKFASVCCSLLTAAVPVVAFAPELVAIRVVANLRTTLAPLSVSIVTFTAAPPSVGRPTIVWLVVTSVVPRVHPRRQGRGGGRLGRSLRSNDGSLRRVDQKLIRRRPSDTPISGAGLTAAVPVVALPPELVAVRVMSGLSAALAPLSVSIVTFTATPPSVGRPAIVATIVTGVVSNDSITWRHERFWCRRWARGRTRRFC